MPRTEYELINGERKPVRRYEVKNETGQFLVLGHASWLPTALAISEAILAPHEPQVFALLPKCVHDLTALRYESIMSLWAAKMPTTASLQWRIAADMLKSCYLGAAIGPRAILENQRRIFPYSARGQDVYVIHGIPYLPALFIK